MKVQKRINRNGIFALALAILAGLATPETARALRLTANAQESEWNRSAQILYGPMGLKYNPFITNPKRPPGWRFIKHAKVTIWNRSGHDAELRKFRLVRFDGGRPGRSVKALQFLSTKSLPAGQIVTVKVSAQYAPYRPGKHGFRIGTSHFGGFYQGTHPLRGKIRF